MALIAQQLRYKSLGTRAAHNFRYDFGSNAIFYHLTSDAFLTIHTHFLLSVFDVLKGKAGDADLITVR